MGRLCVWVFVLRILGFGKGRAGVRGLCKIDLIIQMYDCTFASPIDSRRSEMQSKDPCCECGIEIGTTGPGV